MAALRRSPRARLDLLDIWLRIAEDNLPAADKWLETIEKRVAMLAENPRLGPLRESIGPGVRSFPSGNYLILYRAESDGITLVRVVHGARDPDRFLES